MPNRFQRSFSAFILSFLCASAPARCVATRLCLFVFSVGGDLIPLSEGWPLHRRDGGDRKRPPDSKEGWRWEGNEDKSMMGRGGGQLGAPTDTHFCLSSFPPRAGSRRVTAGLHFWQTRGSSALAKPRAAPPRLGGCNNAGAA